MLTKKEAVWICRRMIKIYHPDYRGNVQAKQKYWDEFLDILHEQGRIDTHDYENWSCPFK